MNAHFKIEYKDEIRRFSCQPDFAILQTTINTLLGLDSQTTLSLKYIDEEDDLCTVSNPAELRYAVSHFPELLRLKVALGSAPKVTSETQPQAKASHQENPEFLALKTKRTALQEARKNGAPQSQIEALQADLVDARNKFKASKKATHQKNPDPFASKSIVIAKRTALQEARKNGAPQSQIEALLADLVDARNKFHASKKANHQTNPDFVPSKSLVVAKRTALQEARKNGAQESQIEALLADLVDARNKFHASKKANHQTNPDFVASKSIVVAKRTALQEARKNGAPKSQIEALLEDLIDARNKFRASKKASHQENPDLFVDFVAVRNNFKAIVVTKRLAFRDAKKNGADKSQLDQLQQEIIEARMEFQNEKAKIQNKNPQDSDMAASKAIVVAKRKALQEARKTGLPKADLQVLVQDLADARVAFRTKKAATC